MPLVSLDSVIKPHLNQIDQFHDPLDYSKLHGQKIDNKFHVNREKEIVSYLSDADLIITSPKTKEASLKDEYPTSEVE